MIASVVIQGAVLTLVLYNAVTALWGWPRPRDTERRGTTTRFRVVIPAHDEAAVVAALLADLRAQAYPPEHFSVWVIADHCTDDTAGAARRGGASVDERADGPRGKGPALAWHLRRHPLDDDAMLVILDADNRVPPDLLARFAGEASAGGEALQAYLDVTNPDASALTLAGALSYWASNRMVQQARRRLGWSADLGGTGMAIRSGTLHRAGGFGDSLTEDTDLGVRLSLGGVSVRWLHDVRVRDEKPADVRVAVRQRARWAAGKRAVVRRHLGALLAATFRRRSMSLLDLVIRLIQPSRTLVAALSAAAAAGAAIWNPWWLFPAPVWIAAAAVQLVLPVPFLVRDGVPARYVARYPVLAILAALWIPIRIVSRLTRGWYHTPHRGTTSP